MALSKRQDGLLAGGRIGPWQEQEQLLAGGGSWQEAGAALGRSGP
jgi:hypothetical protein